jgi:hypothetical protein
LIHLVIPFQTEMDSLWAAAFRERGRRMVGSGESREGGCRMKNRTDVEELPSYRHTAV